jgi:endonuclease YncB( thermonuclease family)
MNLKDINNVFKAEFDKTIDGDTIRVTLDLRVDVGRSIDVRLKDVWAPEKNTVDGKVVMARVESWLRPNPYLIARTYKTSTGKDLLTFTRYVADIWLPDGTFFNQSIVQWMKDQGITDPGIGGVRDSTSI